MASSCFVSRPHPTSEKEGVRRAGSARSPHSFFFWEAAAGCQSLARSENGKPWWLCQQTQRRENALAQFHVPGAIGPPVELDFEGVAQVSLEEFLHLAGQFFAVDFDVDFVVAD